MTSAATCAGDAQSFLGAGACRLARGARRPPERRLGHQRGLRAPLQVSASSRRDWRRPIARAPADGGRVHPVAAPLQHARRHARGRRRSAGPRPATSTTSCPTGWPTCSSSSARATPSSGIRTGSTLGWAAAVLALLTAYIRALSGSLGLPQRFLGPMAKQHRMFAAHRRDARRGRRDVARLARRARCAIGLAVIIAGSVGDRWCRRTSSLRDGGRAPR